MTMRILILLPLLTLLSNFYGADDNIYLGAGPASPLGTIFPGGAVPANTQVVYSNGTQLTGDANFTRTASALVVGGPAGSTTLTINAPTGSASILQLNQNAAVACRLFTPGASPGGLTFNDQINSTNPLVYTPGALSAGFWTIANTTVSSGTGTGSLVVAGGVGIGGSLQTGSNASIANGLTVVAGGASITGTNAFTLTQQTTSGVVRTTAVISPASITTVTASTENSQFIYNTHNQQWATTPPVTQREWLINAPTYSCDTASQTITSAATLAVTNSPQAGTNVTISNPYAIWVQAGNTQLQGLLAAGSVVFSGTNTLAVNQTTINAAIRTTFSITPGNNTAITSGTENSHFIYNSHTQQWATTPPVTQRECVFNAPTYSCDTAAQTITQAATLAIANAPIAGTNVTISNKYAIWVQAGFCLFAGGATINNGLTVGSSLTLSDAVNFIVGSTTGTQIATANTQKLGFWGTTPIAQKTGYGTPTGNVQLASFPGATATLAQTSAELAQLLTDLKAAGIIGN